MPNEEVRKAICDMQIWINQLQVESNTCFNKILDYVEPVGGESDSGLASQASFGANRLAERICDVMGTYDSLLRALGREEHFADFLNKLNS